MKTIIQKQKVTFIITLFILNISLIACEKTEDIINEEIPFELESDQKSAQNNTFLQQISLLPKEDLSQKEIDGLIFLREEEKLARDVYLTLNETFPLRTFENISKSEQQHMDAIKYLLDRYDIEDPANEEEIGSFKNNELQDLFNTLIESGEKEKIAALKVGALIEEKDILDLDHELNDIVDNQDIKFVYENLIRASKNHLRAFIGVLNLNGVDYTPLILEQIYFDEIINKG